MVGEINFLGATQDSNAERAKGVNPLGSFMQGYMAEKVRKDSANKDALLGQLRAMQIQALKQKVDNVPTVEEDRHRAATDKSTATAINNELNIYKLLGDSAHIVYSAPDNSIYQTMVAETLRTCKIRGVDPTPLLEQAHAIYAQDGVAGLRRDAKNIELTAQARLPKNSILNTNDAQLPISQDVDTGQVTQTGAPIPMGIAPGQQAQLAAAEKNNQVLHEDRVAALEAKKSQAASGGSTGLNMDKYPRIAKLMGEGFLPSSGRVTPAWLQSMDAAAASAEKAGTPWTRDTARQYEFETQKNAATGKSAGSRLVIARKENLETAASTLKDVSELSRVVDYSPNKYMAETEQWMKTGGTSRDTDVTALLSARVDNLFALNNALKSTGVTDVSLKMEDAVAHAAMDAPNYDAYVNTQLRALARAGITFNKDYKYDIKIPSVRDARNRGDKYNPIDVELNKLSGVKKHPADIQAIFSKYGAK